MVTIAVLPVVVATAVHLMTQIELLMAMATMVPSGDEMVMG